MFLLQDVSSDLLYKYLAFENRKKKVFCGFNSFCVNYFENSTVSSLLPDDGVENPEHNFSHQHTKSTITDHRKNI